MIATSEIEVKVYPRLYEVRIIKIEDLLIDDRYQRGIQSNSRYIGENFDPQAAALIVVAERANGHLMIVDGLQRTTGAKAAGYSEIACAVFKSSGVVEEARLFAKLNGEHRKKVTPAARFKAELRGREPVALKINNIITQQGFQLDLESNRHEFKWPNINAVRAVEKVYKEGGAAGLELVLNAIMTTWPDDRDSIRESFMIGFWMFYESAKTVGHFDFMKMKEKFRDVMPARILRDAERAQIEKSNSGFARYKFIKIQFLLIYNRRLPERLRLEF